jgi:hypothetical protein
MERSHLPERDMDIGVLADAEVYGDWPWNGFKDTRFGLNHVICGGCRSS